MYMKSNSWSDYPHLLADLDMSKNKNHTFKGIPIDVLDLSCGTEKRLDWKCSTCEHEWQASASNRTSSHFKGGCPACANKSIHIDGRNSMATTHPELAIEYQGDATKVVAGTNKRLMWKCSTCEHMWGAVGSSRVNGCGCPACVNQVIHTDGRNSMATTHPDLASEYQGDATKVTAGTHKKLDWKCSTCEHEWKTTGYSRAIADTGCPVCNRGGLHSDGKNSMAITHPKLAADYQGDATKIIAGSGKPQNWKCRTCEHEWKGIRNVEGGCRACLNRIIHSSGKNSMAVTHPELSKEYQGDATKIVATTDERLDWKCGTCQHTWTTQGKKRASKRKQGCPACLNMVINNFDGRNSMANTHPNLAVEYLGDATNILAGTNKKLDWKCLICEHKWNAQGGGRVSGNGCPSCANQVINNFDARNNMANTHPDLASEYQGDATKVTAGTHKKLPWKCITCEHEWIATGSGRASSRGTGCPACFGHLHSDGQNSMYNTHPKLAKEYQGDANLIIAGTNKKLDWKCGTCEHEWLTSGSNRVGGSGCPACANLAINNYDGRNSLANTHPKLAKEYQDDATKVTAGTHKKLSWKCITCDTEWRAIGKNRLNGNGCPACAKTGYDPSQIGYVYIHQYIDETNHWLKCGITNHPEQRHGQLLRSASRANIEVKQYDIFKFDDGWLAQQCERDLLNMVDIRFNSEYDIEGKAEFFKYSALEEIKNIIEKYL
jgi:Zn finger protein HypA/HybF involved in hydrogenase expression